MLGPMAARSRPHRVVFVVFEGLQGLDLVGPLEVFADANDGLGRAAYELTVAAVEPGQVRPSSGLGVVADVALAEGRGQVDTMVGGSGAGRYEVYDDEEVQEHGRHAGGGRGWRYMSPQVLYVTITKNNIRQN